MSRILHAAVLALGCLAAAAQPARAAGFSSLGLPAELTKPRLQSLLQSFVDSAYGKAFLRLGDERDCDHGHILLDARTGAPVGILYHTQELPDELAAADRVPGAPPRNWLQRLDGSVEDAARYERARYPEGASWDWFVYSDLPRLRGRRTVVDKMLDPGLLGADLGKSRQWTFTRASCATATDDAIRVNVPGSGAVCLELGAS